MEGSEGPSKSPWPDKPIYKIGSATASTRRMDNGLDQEVKRQNELIDRAIKTGRSTILSTHSLDPVGGYVGWGSVCEERDPRRSENDLPYKSVVDLAFKTKDRERQLRGQVIEKVAREGIHEITVITPLTVDIIGTRTIKISKKSIFGTKYTEAEEPYITGQRPQTMAEMMGDSQEPAAAIYYWAEDPSYYGHNSEYRTAIGQRMGNKLEIETIVPLGLAKQISTAVRQDPTFIRRLTEAFVQKYYSEIFKNGWGKFGRPPYQKWDTRPKSKMYFADLITEPGAIEAQFDEKAKERVIEFTPSTQD